MPRSFISIESNEEVRNSLATVQNDLKNTGGDLKIVKPENIHLTLRFLGDVSEGKIEAVKGAIHDIDKIDPFRLQVEGLGVFPKPSYIRVVWAGVSDGEDETKYIREELDKGLAEIGYSPEDREFIPHFTIARVKSGKAKNKINSLVEDSSNRKFGSVKVEEIELRESELTPEGPIYSTIETVHLG